MIGQTLSHYRITAALGAGGMGEVYRATDTKLGRDVAIKVLPAEMANDSGRLERFQREAHLLAALNHPHIAAIHGLEEADGKPFLVLELVEGEDLKERLARGAISVDEALEIAAQVAEALEEAHNAGIVHRDLKPANVKVTPDGKVKVLDFGLAKAWAGEAAEGHASSASMSQSPTLAHSGTQAGVILGTAAYMSPEQARGKPVDKRTDVWAFGVLFWEMLTGRLLFAGDTVTDIIAAVVKEDPDLDVLPVGTPLAVRRLVARCLRKDSRTRLPDIGAARLELQDALAGTPELEGSDAAEDGPSASAQVRRLSRQRWVWAGALLVTAGLGAFLALVHFTESPAARPASHFVVDAPEGWSFFEDGWPVPSPDGRHVVLRAWPRGRGERATLWLRSLDSPTLRLLSGTEVAEDNDPFWSPDGRHVGFFADGALRRLSLADGVVQSVCAFSGQFGGADWSEEGTILFSGVVSEGDANGLYAVPARGGEARLVIKADVSRGERSLTLPQFLPDGRRFFFKVIGEQGGYHVGSLDDPDGRHLLEPRAPHLRLAGGHALFTREGAFLAQPFNAERAELNGEPITIPLSVATTLYRDLGAFGVSPGSTLAYLSGESEHRVQLTWVDRKGERVGALGEPRHYFQIALSPDERRVAVEVFDPAVRRVDLWVIDATRGVARRLTSDRGNERDPVWSPDGQSLVFVSIDKGDNRLFRKGLHGEPAAALQVASGADGGKVIPESWSRDGTTLLYKTFNGTTIWALPMEGGGDPEAVLEVGFGFDEPLISPDGRWLAYHSEESGEGEWEVYVQPFRRPGERVRVSVDGGVQPKWRGDGRELFYLTPGKQMMAVDFREGDAGLEVSQPSALFEIKGPLRGLHQDHYAVSADGQRFLVKEPIEAAQELQMHVVLNWKSLLEPEK